MASSDHFAGLAGSAAPHCAGGSGCFASNSGTFWALVVLDPSVFKSKLDDSSLDPAIRERADHSFAELDAATTQ